MNKCATCKHWRRNYADEYGSSDPRYGLCDNERLAYAGEGVSKTQARLGQPDALVYWDVEGYHAHLETGEGFGCVHHEPITSAPGGVISPSSAPLDIILASIFNVEEALDKLAACFPDGDPLRREAGVILVAFQQRRYALKRLSGPPKPLIPEG